MSNGLERAIVQLGLCSFLISLACSESTHCIRSPDMGHAVPSFLSQNRVWMLPVRPHHFCPNVPDNSSLLTSQDVLLRTAQDFTAYLSPQQTAATRWKHPWNLGASMDGGSSWTAWCSSHCSRTSTLQLKQNSTRGHLLVDTSVFTHGQEG